ncbi:MAG: segregation/condensation protein A [Nanoarchaeota archaeon]|nr:segregation/condensation protein A [Nanoarchaeota archaeon]
MEEEVQKPERIQQEQFHHFIFNNQTSWKELLYDLINTEQLDPWDIDLSILANKYLTRIRELEETNFILSSKVLLVASLMLKLKSELIINKYIKDLDDVLFDRKKQEVQEKIKFTEFEEGEIPELIIRTPLPRYKKVSLQELITALEQAVKTESRRETKKQIEFEQEERIKYLMPKKTISLNTRIKNIHLKINSLFKKNEKIKFSEFAPENKQGKINHFIPLLHLDNHNKLWLAQENHFDEIWIHKDGSKFINRDEIITGKIEEKFEESLN